MLLSLETLTNKVNGKEKKVGVAGIINEDVLEKEAYSTWKIVLDK